MNAQKDREMINISQFSPRVTRSKSKQLQQQQQQQQQKEEPDVKKNVYRQKKADDETRKKTVDYGKTRGKKSNKKPTGELNESVVASKGSVGSFSLLHTPKKCQTFLKKTRLGGLLTPKNEANTPKKSFQLKSPKIETISADTPERSAHFYKKVENISDCRLRILGKGSFGTIIQATYKGELVAAKIVPPHKANTLENELNNFFLSHPNVVKTLRIISNEENRSCGLVIMEMCSSFNLENLANEEAYFLDDATIIGFMTDISQALDYCHSKKVLHLDVKPKNILVNVTKNVCKLCDFGSSCLLMGEFTYVNRADYKTLQSTAVYTSPELLSGGSPTDKCDVYSFGITLWQLVHRKKPYVVDNKMDLQSTIYKVVKQKKRPQTNIKKNEKLENLYVRCWDHEPDQRPTMKEVVQYLKSIHLS